MEQALLNTCLLPGTLPCMVRLQHDPCQHVNLSQAYSCQVVSSRHGTLAVYAKSHSNNDAF